MTRQPGRAGHASGPSRHVLVSHHSPTYLAMSVAAGLHPGFPGTHCTRSPWVASSAEKQPRSGEGSGSPHSVPGSEGLRKPGAGRPGLGVTLGKGQLLGGAFCAEARAAGPPGWGGASCSPTLLEPHPSQLLTLGHLAHPPPTCLPIPLQWATQPTWKCHTHTPALGTCSGLLHSPSHEYFNQF